MYIYLIELLGILREMFSAISFRTYLTWYLLPLLPFFKFCNKWLLYMFNEIVSFHWLGRAIGANNCAEVVLLNFVKVVQALSF